MKTERISIRTTKALKDKIEKVAAERKVTVSEMINDYIKRLPIPRDQFGQLEFLRCPDTPGSTK